MMTVACVMRSGGAFVADHVRYLADGVRRHLHVPHRFVCLTDAIGRPPASEVYGHPFGSTIVPLVHDWPGWWAKMELFRVPGPVLYCDLDTVIVGDIDALANAVTALPSGALLMLDDFYRHRPASGIMGWAGGMDWMYERFRDKYARTARWIEGRRVAGYVHGMHMAVHNKRWRGDQDWLRDMVRHCRVPVTIAQHVVPGIVSFKVDVRPTMTLPDGACVVCFHGEPRPWDLDPRPEWMPLPTPPGTNDPIPWDDAKADPVGDVRRMMDAVTPPEYGGRDESTDRQTQ